MIKIQNVLKLLFYFLLASTVLASLLAAFGSYNSYLELLTHFQLQYLIASLFFLVFLLLLKRKRLCLLVCIWILYLLIPLLPYYWPIYQPRPKSEAHSQLKIMQLNVMFSNLLYAKVLKLIHDEQPDIIGLEEFTQNWATHLKPLEKMYPYHMLEPDPLPFGLALYSKYPLTNQQIEHSRLISAYDAPTLLSIAAQINLNHQPIHLIVTHPFPPLVSDIRNRQLAILGSARSRYGKNLILLGDLNTSPWSPYFKRLLQQTGLRDSQQGFGVQPTWPEQYWWMRTPIDHILISPEIDVIKRYIGPAIGSDHLPVITVLQLK